MATQTTKRGSRSRAEWEQLVTEYEKSGQSRRIFCAYKSIPLSSFGYWCTKLKRETPAAGFIELTPAPACAGWDVELELGAGVVLRLRRS